MVAFRFVAKDGTQVLFREPKSKDTVHFMRFINPMTAEKRSGILMNKRVNLKGETAWLRSWLADIRNRKGVMLVVEVDGRIMGNCVISRLSWKSSHGAEVGIALSREMRGRGIGEALMKKTIELARTRMRNLEMLHLKSFEYNERAQALYRKMGFVEVGRIPKANKEGKEYFDDVLMVKFL